MAAENSTLTELIEHTVQNLYPHMQALISTATSVPPEQQMPTLQRAETSPYLAVQSPDGSAGSKLSHPSGPSESLLHSESEVQDRKKEDTTPPIGMSAVRNILPSLFKVNVPTVPPGSSPASPYKDGIRSLENEHLGTRDVMSVDQEEARVEVETSKNGRPEEMLHRSRSISHPIAVPSNRISSAPELSVLSPSFPSPLETTARLGTSTAVKKPSSLPTTDMNLHEEQYQQLYQQWHSELTKLKQMGFEDTRKNMDLIIRHKGSLVDVVEELLIKKETRLAK